MEGHAPAFLQFKVMGVPYAAVGISALLGPLAYMTLGVGTANVGHLNINLTIGLFFPLCDDDNCNSHSLGCDLRQLYSFPTGYSHPTP